MAAGKSSSQSGGTPRKRNRNQTKAQEKADAGEKLPLEKTLEGADRARLIYVEWLENGNVISVIAEKHKLTPRRVNQLIDEALAANMAVLTEGGIVAGVKYAERLLANVEYDIQRATQVYNGALEAKNWSAAAGAVRRIEVGRDKQMKLHQDLGLLPKKLVSLTYFEEVREMIKRMFLAFADHDVPLEVAQQIAETVEMEARRRDGKLELVERNVIEGEAA